MCHDLFPMLSPLHVPVPGPHQNHLTDPLRTPPTQSVPITPGSGSRTHPFRIQTKTRTMVGMHTHGPEDAIAIPDHMAIMWWPYSCVTHTTSSQPTSQQTWDLRVPTLFLLIYFHLIHANASFDCSKWSYRLPVLIPNSGPNCMHSCSYSHPIFLMWTAAPVTNILRSPSQ